MGSLSNYACIRGVQDSERFIRIDRPLTFGGAGFPFFDGTVGGAGCMLAMFRKLVRVMSGMGKAGCYRYFRIIKLLRLLKL